VAQYAFKPVSARLLLGNAVVASGACNAMIEIVAAFGTVMFIMANNSVQQMDLLPKKSYSIINIISGIKGNRRKVNGEVNQ
jgi:hypothetical protein